SPDEVKKIIIETVAGLARQVPTKDEGERAKTRMLQRMDRTMAESGQLAVELNEVIASGDWRLLFTNYEELRRVTPDDVVRVANLYFKDSNRTVGIFIPDAAPTRTAVPDAPKIDDVLALYTPTITIENGDALDPSPANIDRRIERSTLPGGFRLALLPKGTRGN